MVSTIHYKSMMANVRSYIHKPREDDTIQYLIVNFNNIPGESEYIYGVTLRKDVARIFCREWNQRFRADEDAFMEEFGELPEHRMRYFFIPIKGVLM